LEKPEKRTSALPIESPVNTSVEHVKELEDELLKLRIENAFLKDLLSYTGMFMYWQKRFDRVNPDKPLEEMLLAIRENHKDYGYRRVVGELHNRGCKVNMCNGEILSFGIDKHPSAQNVMNTLEQAIKITSDCPYRRTFHSD
jgi:hypothetical protein